MDKKDILSRVDHTLLDRAARWSDIKLLCDDALRFGTASVCIPPSFVKQTAEYLGGRMAVCTVIGFPNGYNTTAVKCAETREAVENGADEIDMVINIGWLKEGKYDELLCEINAIKAACGGKLLKVIIETCVLTEEEKIKMCEIVSASDADYIKTSTGFAGGGATFDDIALFAEHVSGGLKIKAAGGIRSFEDAEKFISLGADRLGTSALVKLMKA
ncbi:MAG: deoxyribose-phosphate aldolase [Clostridia bacterium]|nr:deoxyribose-phosphate aldolase [Clostridia bacterium]